jgi:hypothetical protein
MEHRRLSALTARQHGSSSLLLLALFALPVSAEDSARIEALLQRIEALEARLRALETERRPEPAGSGTLREELLTGTSGSAEAPTPEATARDDAVAADEQLAQAVLGSERESKAPPPAPPPSVDVGGALRFNVVHRDFVDSSEGKYGESGLDVFRLNIDGELDNILVSAEYRFYTYMDTIHHGWVGYQFEDQSQLQVGIHQVPFGLLPYAAHNAWFGVPYYLGLADDYDMGIRYQRQDGPWSSHLAFYKNEELNSAGDLDRYSFDLVLDGDQQNEEIDQFNARLAYTLGLGSGCETELGASAQRSELYNSTSDRRGEHWAGALHLDSRCGRWNLQLQGIRYDYDPANPPGLSRDAVRVGAFGGSYDIAGSADVLVANIAYNFASPWPFIDQVTCYNDYSRLFKDGDGQIDSQINTLGCAIGSGPLFTYVDYILANNMAFFGNGSMAAGGEDEWRGRFNVNIGFYW